MKTIINYNINKKTYNSITDKIINNSIIINS